MQPILLYIVTSHNDISIPIIISSLDGIGKRLKIVSFFQNYIPFGGYIPNYLSTNRLFKYHEFSYSKIQH